MLFLYGWLILSAGIIIGMCLNAFFTVGKFEPRIEDKERENMETYLEQALKETGDAE